MNTAKSTRRQDGQLDCPDALVIGLCSHGLAITRRLYRKGLSVVGIESNHKLPGTKTNSAHIVYVSALNESALIFDLRQIARDNGWRRKPVLFPTNDRIVQLIGNSWPELADYYILSWGACCEQVLRLANKETLSLVCEEHDIRHPRSLVIRTETCVDGSDPISFMPGIVKPCQPMGQFKACRVESISDIRKLVEDFPESLPFILQEWIDGPTESLEFVAGYAENGTLIAAFAGKKMRSWPPGIGQGTVITPTRNPLLWTQAEKLVRLFNITGPIALEFKRTPQGEYYFIEANVGRTEYCTEAAAANKIDLAWIEYSSVHGMAPISRSQLMRYVWYDTDRDPFSYLHGLKSDVRTGNFHFPVFPYASFFDPWPFVVATLIQWKRLILAALNRNAKVAEH